MGRSPVGEGALAEARQRFFSGHQLPEGLVAEPILRSWLRCAEQGLHADDPVRVEPLNAAELRELQERNELLRQLSRPEIGVLRSEAKLTDSVVIITDAHGIVLDAVGSIEFAGRASEVALRPGVAWGETSTGTNAIGTALVERRPIAVHGAEHFFEPHKMLTCAAAPIFDPRGRLAGVLDMSGHAAAQHMHALGLVRLAVEQVEHRFFSRGFANSTVLRFHQDRELLGTPREGILVFEDGKLVAGNRRGMKLMNLDRGAFKRVTISELFEQPEAQFHGEELRTHSGDVFAISRSEVPTRAVKGFALPDPTPQAYFVPETKAALARAVRLADAGIPLLIQGETGTGKEVFVRELHRLCARSGKPFVAINCAALPEALIEAELFGYEEGAFTGARKQGQKGLIRQAEGGVLFLDEIGDMPLGLQSRMLRALQDREVTPLGGGKPFAVDFLPVSATHQPLKSRVEEGKFRADLYFRLAQYVVELPPLRELSKKAEMLKAMWQQAGGEARGVTLSPEAEARLIAYQWPGNFRQLAGMLRALLALAEPGETLAIAALPPEILDPPALERGGQAGTLEALAEDSMRAALEANGGNISRAARTLGIDRSTLYRRLMWKTDREPSRH